MENVGLKNNRKLSSNIISECQKMQDILEVVRKVAYSNVPVLICGEPGVGKKIIARAIHDYYANESNPFVQLNCSMLNNETEETEVFGLESNIENNSSSINGKLEEANNGTLFLEEVEMLSIVMQIKLLRFLQEKKITRVNSSEPVSVNTRLIGSTVIDLKKEIEKEKIRSDFFYRFSVIKIDLPPLREREEDVVKLADLFLERYAREYDKEIINFDSDVLEKIKYYQWPGNVQELKNRIKKGVVLAEKKIISSADLGFDDNLPGRHESLPEIITDIQKKYINKALFRNRGNISRAAKDLGISRMTFYDLMNRLKINIRDHRRN